MNREAKAAVNPVRQRTQFSCMSASMMMCLKANGIDCDEDEVNKVMGAKPMQGASWEDALACAQHYGMRGTLTSPCTVGQLQEWTARGVPVMIAWNPEDRDWSHASVVFDVEDRDDGKYIHVADPNIPNPTKTVRVVHEDAFYGKWSEKWPKYLVRRPAMAIEREVTPEGRQVLAKTAQRKYPWELRDAIRSLQWSLKPKEVSDGKVSGTVFYGFAEGSVPGGKGVFTVLRPPEFDTAQELGLVERGKKVKFHEVSTAPYGHLDLNTYDKVLTTLTAEGQRVADTPLKDLLLKRSKLPGKLEQVAQVYEALQNAGESVSRILDNNIYKGQDPWHARNWDWYQSLRSKYPDIVTNEVFEAIFRRPSTMTGWQADLWDILSKKGQPPSDWYKLKDLKDHTRFANALIVKAFKETVSQSKLKRALGTKAYDRAFFFDQVFVNEDRLKELRQIILKHFPLSPKLKKALTGTPSKSKSKSKPKTVVDSAVAQKLTILDELADKVRGWPEGLAHVKAVQEMYHRGRKPSDDDLKKLRNYLYKNRMRSEADHFRQAADKDAKVVPPPDTHLEQLSWVDSRPGWKLIDRSTGKTVGVPGRGFDPDSTLRTSRRGQISYLEGDPVDWLPKATVASELLMETNEVEAELGAIVAKRKKKRQPAKLRDPAARARAEQTGAGGAGKHQTRDRDVATGRSRKPKHKKDWGKESKVDEKLMDRARNLLGFLRTEKEVVAQLVESGVHPNDAYLAVKAAKLMDPYKKWTASYSGNPNGEPIYENEIDHGYDQPISGGNDVMKALQNKLLLEQGSEPRPKNPRIAECVDVENDPYVENDLWHEYDNWDPGEEAFLEEYTDFMFTHAPAPEPGPPAPFEPPVLVSAPPVLVSAPPALVSAPPPVDKSLETAPENRAEYPPIPPVEPEHPGLTPPQRLLGQPDPEAAGSFWWDDEVQAQVWRNKYHPYRSVMTPNEGGHFVLVPPNEVGEWGGKGYRVADPPQNPRL